MTDAVVVGAGPAGVACALALQARGLRVVVAERRLRGTRGTPGETLPGRVRGALAALGLADVLDDWACTPIHTHRTRWGAALREHNLASDPNGHGWQVDRERFDELLRLRAAELGIDVRLGMRCTSVVAETGGWRVTLDQDRGRSSLRAAFIVDATGRSAFVARRLGAQRERCDRSIALVAGILGPAANRGATLVEVCPTGWWSATTLPSDDVALNFVTDAALVPPNAAARATAFLDHIATAPLVERYLAGCGAPAWLRVVSAAPALTAPLVGDGWLATGDAAAVHDPLAFSGVTTALEQGTASAAAIVAWLGGDLLALARHRARIEAEFHAHLHARHAYYAVPGLSRFPFWRTRAVASAPSLAPAPSLPRAATPWWPVATPPPHRAPDDAVSRSADRRPA
jgi:flavin-dependent dehydrogenase